MKSWVRFPLGAGVFSSLLLLSFRCVYLIRSLKEEQQTHIFLNIMKKWMLSSAAWGETSIIRTDLAKSSLKLTQFYAMLKLVSFTNTKFIFTKWLLIPSTDSLTKNLKMII